ncbi:N-acetylmuramoyl-L-alanine amidase-like domain-containing protein [Algivirga pacifica]|uniref:DUF1460 domain-containing protein n=1 Tax=Algivirga pacifica TaxID=1162670 RepID=A0ABP9DHD5_9BACT
MKRIFYLLIGLSLTLYQNLYAQVHCLLEDKDLFQEKIELFENENLPGMPAHHIAATVGKSFVGVPYVASTLEVGDKEQLVVNFRELDCTTFLENVVVFSLILEERKTTFEEFTEQLQKVRYRGGELNGYVSRLHYFSEWIADNQKKGYLRNITKELGGVPLEKEINFMGTHRQSYKHLKTNEENYQHILKVEEQLKELSLYYIPQEDIETIEGKMQAGDLIAITTSIKGLDVSHVGVAYEQQGRIHLMHASTTGQVVISEEPLADYIKKHKKQTGIIVSRLR